MDAVDTGRIGTGTYGEQDGVAARGVVAALWRGAVHRCPACGRGAMFRAFLKVAEACPDCGEDLSHQRADDAPPYVTILVVGHLILAAVVGIDIAYAWPMWLHVAVWFPLTVALCLAVLPSAKGALVGLQWALRMHGFGECADGGPHRDPGLGHGAARP